jgi:hypothetical protein
MIAIIHQSAQRSSLGISAEALHWRAKQERGAAIKIEWSAIRQMKE